MRAKNLETMLDMLDGKALDDIDRPVTLLAAYGGLASAMACLAVEIGRRDAEQEADKLFELLLVISSTAMLAAAEHVLPVLEGGDRE